MSQVMEEMFRSEDVEENLDEQTLRCLLDESSDFDFRRRVRARLRQLKKEASPAIENGNRLIEPQRSHLEPQRSYLEPQRSYLEPHRSHLAPHDRPKSVRVTQQNETQNGEKEFIEKSAKLRTVKSTTMANRSVSTTESPPMETVSLRSSPRSAIDSTHSRRLEPPSARLQTIVLRKVTAKPTKDEIPKSRSNAEKMTTKAAFERFKEMDLHSDTGGGSSRYLEAGENGGRAAVGRRALSQNSIRDQTLDWCRARISLYDGITLQDFSTSWNDGMAFCALVHSFYPEAFDYDTLDRKNKAKNFQLAFDTAEDLGGVVPLLDVEDMVRTSTPDWKCVFTYVNSFANRMSEIRKGKKQSEQLQRDKELEKEHPDVEEEEKQEQDQEERPEAEEEKQEQDQEERPEAEEEKQEQDQEERPEKEDEKQEQDQESISD